MCDFWIDAVFCAQLININLTSVTTGLFVQPMLFVGFGPSSRYGQCYAMAQETHFKTGEFVTLFLMAACISEGQKLEASCHNLSMHGVP